MDLYHDSTLHLPAPIEGHVRSMQRDYERSYSGPCMHYYLVARPQRNFNYNQTVLNTNTENYKIGTTFNFQL